MLQRSAKYLIFCIGNNFSSRSQGLGNFHSSLIKNGHPANLPIRVKKSFAIYTFMLRLVDVAHA